jgi:hypothetical protein
MSEPPVEKNAAAVALGRLGASKGGKARAAKLSPEDRARIASVAAKTRWGKKGVTTLPDPPADNP